ncbi:adenosine-specific kinase [Patescibacteria group bacterium]
MSLKTVKIINPKNLNIIFGISHFIKTVEDFHETLVSSVPNIKFGLAFSEASGPRLIRTTGTSKDLEKLAAENLLKIGAGHSFLIILENCFPINVLTALKKTDTLVSIFCATANPVEVVIFETKKGNSVLGVVDGGGPKGIEDKKSKKERMEFLRKIGYKL